MKTEPAFSGRGFTVLLGPAEEGLRPSFEKPIRDQDALIVFSPAREELVSLLEGAGLYVGQDSGITHLAAMLGTPTLALFRRPSVLQWRPLGPKVRVILHPEPDPDLVSLVLSEAGFLMEGHDEGR
jgi:ADP-heptose:LPS heptosyltransferase